MTGKDEDGVFQTTAQSRYPSELCEILAACIIDVIMISPRVGEQPAPGAKQCGHSGLPSGCRDHALDPNEHALDGEYLMAKAPSINEAWDPLERWSETFRVRWKGHEHNNIGELRTLILALRHLARSSGSWDKRVLLITDSLVSLGVLAKGRSASWPLLRLARQAAALVMTIGIRPYYRYVESKRNHADGPSRGSPIGVAPAWVGAKERREMFATIAEKARQRETSS